MLGLRRLITKIQWLLNNGLFSVLISNVIVKFVSFFPSVFLARLLTKPELAAVSYADNLLVYLTTFAGLGLSSSVLRYSAKSEDRKKGQAYFIYALSRGIVSNLVLAMFVGLALHLFWDFKFAHAKGIFYALILTPTLSYVFEVIMIYIRTQLRFRLYGIVNVLYTLSKLVALIAMTYFFALPGMIVARYLSLLLIIGVLAWTTSDSWRKSSSCLSKKEKSQFTKYSIASLISVAFSTLMPINQSFLVNNLLSDEIITANYKVAMAIPHNLVFVSGALLVYFTPHFSRHEHDRKWVRKYSVTLGAATLGLYTIFAIILITFSGFIMTVLFGEKYVDAAMLMRQLTIVYCVNAGFRMVPMNILYSIGYVKFNASVTAVTCVLQLVLDYIFITSFGIRGIGYSSMIVYFASGLAFWYYLITRTCIGKESLKVE